MELSELRESLSGTLVGGTDHDWDTARLFHSGIGEPAVIVRPASVEDVVAAVRFAVAEGLDIDVRGGGHSAWGTLPGALTIDLGGLRAVTVDGRRVSVGGGALWGQVARELAPHGLGLSSGDTASVGVGGLTLGGGIGWMVRAWGLAIDQLVGAQVVTARGDVVETSAESHPDLFWALRGGGGNFGVVTRFDFEAHPLPRVAFADIQVSGDPRPVVRAIRELARSAPREITITFMDVPPMDPSAPPGMTVTACWAGDDADALRAALAPVLALEGVGSVDLRVRDYPDILLDAPAFDPDVPMPGFIGGNTLLREPDDAVLDGFVEFHERYPMSVLFLRTLGGAYGDADPDDSAFVARDADLFAMVGAFVPPDLTDEDQREIQTAWDALEPLGVGVYGNFTTTTDRAYAQKMYPPEMLARLTEIKQAWDPENVFSRNHNVPPA